MVNPIVRAYMQVQKPRERLQEAGTRIDAAYLLYQQALARFGPFPGHGWDRRALAAREDALAGAIEEFRATVGAQLAALAALELRPPF